MRYLLQRGPSAATSTPAASGGSASTPAGASSTPAGAPNAPGGVGDAATANQISLSAATSTTTSGVTTTKVWVPGDDLVEAILTIMGAHNI